MSKTHPGLVPYDDLSDSAKDYDRQTEMETLKAILVLEYESVRSVAYARIRVAK